ncbi:hypothetical protein BGZ70_007406 [Mortierella alpina]|uniref:Uncharacterized protein n=1 Tax=Mortierella alpina TaxID=64518 RepID=A0A9P6J6L1_MORAP|nr:hypothetical protein BGZ70_007406 [Mortierella alpina]
MMKQSPLSQPPSYSVLAPPQHLQSPRVCCISLNGADKLRLIGTPPELTNPIRAAINTSWGPIQEESNYHGTHQFKARRLLTGVLREMAQQGWNLIQSSDVSKKQGDKDSLFFESIAQSHGVMDVGAVDMFAVSFNSTDKIRVIDAGTHVVTAVREAVQLQWKAGIKREEFSQGAIEFKLSGYPFVADASEAVYSRMMLSQVLANLRALGYKLYASVDISMGHEGMDVESWVFRSVGPAWE